MSSDAQALADPRLACERLQWLPAEASARRFARLHAPARVEAATAVLMVFTPGTPPEEVRRVERSTDLLAAVGVPVPCIHDSEASAGWILQEDLGDVTLSAALEAGHDPTPLYDEALGILPRLSRARLDTSPRPPLDGTRLRAELQVFVETALPHRASGLAADLDRVVTLCASAPRRLCHRDYHARNLMLHEGRVRVVDHQDAMAGPAPYDVVSLAYDPYVDLPDDFRDRLAGDVPGTGAVAVQRLCKAIGTYAGKGGRWERWIPPAARTARRLVLSEGLLQAGRAGLADALAELDAAP